MANTPGRNAKASPSKLSSWLARPLRLEQLEDRSVPALFIVTSTADTAGLTSQTVFAPFTYGSLRSAIEASNARPGADTITFDPTAFATPQTITLTNGQLNITDDLTITGTGAANLTIDANNLSRVFNIDDGTSSVKTITLSGLTITGGRTGGSGGGILSSENLTIQNSTNYGNLASIVGGGVYGTGTTTIQNSTFYGNSAVSGGGIFINGTAVIQNSTISKNSANSGGGIYNGGTTTVQNSTISENSALYSGGGFFNKGGPLTIQNSIISGNMAASATEIMLLSGRVNLNANNLIGSSAVSTGHALDIVAAGASDILATSDGTNPTALAAILMPLANNGGPTQTHALVAGSPAINAGNNANAVDTNNQPFATDQRGTGFNRILNGTVDIGAYEAPEAASSVVTSNSDSVNAFDGLTSLREAINYANSRAGADTITFDSTVFATPQTITLGGTELIITDDLTITGPTARVTINANKASRVFNIDDGNSSTFKAVIIDGLTISGGSTGSGGGGIANDENLTIENSSISGNTANAGGGIFNNFNVVMQNSTISGNSSSNAGGGVFNAYKSTIQNSTISGNSATNGGSIFNNFNVVMQNSTISGNSASNVGGGVYNRGITTLQNTVIAGNLSTNNGREIFRVSGTITANSNNLLGASSSTNAQAFAGFTRGVSDITATSDGTNPTALSAILSPLANNGGPTQTHALVAGSPAINAGNNANIPVGFTTDQRGSNRIAGGTVDIGAFEADEAPSLVVTTSGDVVNSRDGVTSLREAIAYANSKAGADTITFGDGSAISGGTNFLDATPDTITLSGTQLTLASDVTITGSSGGVTISGGWSGGAATNGSRVFQVNSGVTATLAGLTISAGNANSGNSGGGGVLNQGTLTINQSTINGNTTSSGGGGVSNQSGTLTISQSTISGNSGFSGGGLFNIGGTLNISQSTIAGNSARISRGGISINSGTVNLQNSLIVGNTASSNPETGGTYTDGGGNIIGLDSGETLGQVIAVDSNGKPLLANNGGPTQTIALVAGSRAINAGNNSLIPVGSTTDQTSSPRIGLGQVDIGAYEFRTPNPTSIVVDSTAEGIDGDISAGKLTLREAIAIANDRSGADMITFDPTVFATPQTVTLGGNQLTITDDLSITGPTGGVTLSGNNASRVFQVDSGVTATLSGLTLTAGYVADNGSGGGGVRNFGTLTINQSTISGNTVGNASGGGISNFGTLKINQSTISGNTASAESGIPGIGNGKGGGVYNLVGTLTINQSTISGNRAESVGGGIAGAGTPNLIGTVTIIQSTIVNNSGLSGGGLSGFNTTANIVQSTFAGNYGGFDGGGIDNGNGTFNVWNSLIVGNTASSSPETGGNFTDGGGNIIGLANGETLGQVLAVDSNGKPLLANNGGPTQTVALVAGSRAINAGVNANAVDANNQPLSTDQRGSNRIAGGTVDIGAFEVQTVSTVTSLTSSVVSSIYGDSVQFKATIFSTELVQSGSVRFSIDGNTFGSPVSLVNGEASFTISSLTAGSHNIAASYIPVENSLFLASDSSISFDVAKKEASVTPNSLSKIYGSADPTLTGTISGFLSSDNVTATYTRVAGENVKTGGYAIMATLQPSEVVGNYEISYGTGTFTITPKDAIVTIDNKSKFFGFADPTLTGSISGFLTSDNISAIYTRVAGETVGNYEIRATLSPIELLGNYNIRTTNGNLQIKALPPTFAYDFDNAAKFTASGFQSVQGITLPAVGGTTPTLYTPGGFGWVGTAPSAVDQGSIFGASQLMLRDFNTDTVSRTFRTDVGMSNTDYFVTAIVGASLNGMTIMGANGTIIHPRLEADQLTNIVTPAGQAMSLRFKVTSNANGQIDLAFGNKNAGQSWSIAGLILRETSVHSPLTITRQDGQSTAVSADGTTEDIYVVTGANPGALIDLSTTLGTITSVSTTGLAGSWTSDASTILAGKQIVADATGKFFFKLQRPNSPTSTTAKMVIHQFDGTTHGEFTQSYTGFSAPTQPPLIRKIDLDSITSNIPNTYTPTGWESYTAKLYDASVGYGWTNISGLTARYTAAYSVPGDTVTSLLNRDSHLSTQSRDFQIDVAPNTTYSIEVGLGDARGVYDKMKVEFVGGTSQSNLATTATSRFIKTTVTGTSDASGKITVRFSSLGIAGYAVSYISATPVLGQLNTNSPTASANGSGNNINSSNVQALVGTAIDFWAKAGATQSQISTLQNASVTVADLGGTLLGTASTGRIIIDDNAAGAGWSTSTTSVQSGKYDLLTVLMHEMGHLLGLDDVYKPGSTSLMTGKLEAGTRKLPTVSDLQSSIAPIQVSTQVSPMPTIGGSKATPTVSIPSIDLVQAVDSTTVTSTRRR
jgi:hypothetical protein